MEVNPMSQITCDTIGPLLSAFVDGESDSAERLRIEEHVACCPSCASHLGFLQALRRAPGVPSLVAPPSDLAAIVARATFAKPTWRDRLAELLRPAPVRVGLAGAFVLAIGVTALKPSPTPTSTSGERTRITKNTAPVPETRLTTGSGASQASPPAPPAVKLRVARVAVAPTPRPTYTAPKADIRPAAFRRTTEPSASVAALPTPQPGGVSRTPDAAAAVVETAAATRTVTPTVSDTMPSAAPTPAPTIQVARAATSSHELARDDEDMDARASYEAGLQAQSESSRRRFGGGSAGGNALLSVVRAPVTTTNH